MRRAPQLRSRRLRAQRARAAREDRGDRVPYEIPCKARGFALCFLSIYMRRAEDSDSVVRRLFIVAHTREPPSWQRPFDSAALRLAVTGGHLSWIWSDLPGQSCLALQAPSSFILCSAQIGSKRKSRSPLGRLRLLGPGVIPWMGPPPWSATRCLAPLPQHMPGGAVCHYVLVVVRLIFS